MKHVLPIWDVFFTGWCGAIIAPLVWEAPFSIFDWFEFLYVAFMLAIVLVSFYVSAIFGVQT